MSEVKQKYASTETELYSIGELAINNLEADLAKFVLKKAKYDAAFVLALRGLRTAAMLLPDEEARNGVHQTLKNLLPGLLVPVKDNFNDLKGYIRDAWPGEEPKPRYEAAGLVKYNAIGESNWENVAGLCESMTQFISANSVKLKIPGGMPLPFGGKVTADGDAFKNVYDPFLTSRETSTARAAKITANNLMYDAMMDFMKDGVEMVFRNSDEDKKRYTFHVLKNLVSPPGSASLKVTVKNGLDIMQPNKNVTIKKAGAAPITLPTDVNGIDLFMNLTPGKYEGEVDNGGVTVKFTKEVGVGTDARVIVVVP